MLYVNKIWNLIVIKIIVLESCLKRDIELKMIITGKIWLEVYHEISDNQVQH